jgi:polyhydroxybutyrate depolymerase
MGFQNYYRYKDFVLMLERFRSRQIRGLATFVCALAALTACTRSMNDKVIREKGQIQHDGLVREYVLLKPAVLEDEKSYPLVLALHGGGGDGKRMCRLRGGIQEFATQEGYFVLCPDGFERHWNDGRNIDRWRAHSDDIDDVGFLLELIDLITVQYPIDRERLFVTGMSNGGKMSLRLACEASETFRAAAAVIASLPADLKCEPRQPISIMIMNGTEDPLVPWIGGQVRALGQPLGEALSTPETISFWVAENDCETEPAISSLADIVLSDQSSIQLDLYADCLSGEQVALYTVAGGGHTWPGGAQYLPKFLIGQTNQDAHAGKLIWEFFEQVID